MTEARDNLRAFAGGVVFTIVFVVVPMVIGLKWKAIVNGAWP